MGRERSYFNNISTENVEFFLIFPIVTYSHITYRLLHAEIPRLPPNLLVQLLNKFPNDRIIKKIRCLIRNKNFIHWAAPSPHFRAK